MGKRYALRRLGGGRDHEAYLAWDERLFSLVVAKCLRPHLIHDADARARFEREATMLSLLSHPVIVRSFDSVLTGDRPHIVLEHLEGPHLKSLISDHGPLPLEQLLPLTVQICSAVHHLAVVGVVHLDVKPSNVIMGVPPRLVDLSVARTVEDASRIDRPVGTAAYMAPEQCDPSGTKPGPTSDVWGLGATLYHAVAGRPPFPDASRDGRRYPQLQRDPDPLPDAVAPALGDVITAALSRRPKDRPSPAEIVATIEPLVAALPARPVLRRSRPRWR